MIAAEDPDNTSLNKETIEAGALIVQGFEKKLSQIYAAACDKLLPIHNSTRNDGRNISATAFKKNLSVNCLDLDSTRITAYLGAGSLFQDHGVEIRMDRNLKISEILVS